MYYEVNAGVYGIWYFRTRPNAVIKRDQVVAEMKRCGQSWDVHITPRYDEGPAVYDSVAWRRH